MACFLVPAAEAVVTTVISKTLKNKENNDGTLTVAGKIKWLNNMLWIRPACFRAFVAR